MNSNNNPYIDPSNNDSLAGTIRLAFNKLMQGMNGMLPAMVMAYNRESNRAQVQILISIVSSDGSVLPRAQIASIPVLVLGGGGFFLSFPLKNGDLGWILANDRDISLFLQSYAQAAPNTQRMMNFADGLFIPDIMRNYTINTEDAAHAVLSNLDGSVRIAMWPDQVKITSPLTTIDGALTVTGLASLGNMTVTGSMDASGAPGGTFHVHGNITASGTVTWPVGP